MRAFSFFLFLCLPLTMFLSASAMAESGYQTIADKIKARNQRPRRERVRRPEPSETHQRDGNSNAIEAMRQRLQRGRLRESPQEEAPEDTGYQTIADKIKARNMRRRDPRPRREARPRREPIQESEGSYMNIADKIKARNRRPSVRRSERPAPRRGTEAKQPTYQELLEWYNQAHPSSQVSESRPQPTRLHSNPEPTSRRGVPADGEEDPSAKLKRLLKAKQSQDRWGR